MNTLQFKVGDALILQLEARNDVAIEGWGRDIVEMVLDGELDQCTIEQGADVLKIDSRVPVSISIPRGAKIHIGEAGGDLILRKLQGEISVDAARGDCLLKSGDASASIRAVFGDLTVESWAGDLSVQEAHEDVRLGKVDAHVSLGQVSGDVRARAIGGDLAMGAVSEDVRVYDVAGDLTLEDGQGGFRGEGLQGGMDVRLVKEDISLKTALTRGKAYRGRAGGSVVARFPAGTSARFTLEAGGQLVAKIPQIEHQEAGRIIGCSGEGEAEVVLQAGEDLSLKVRGERAHDEGFEIDFDSDISAQIEAQIAKGLGGLDLNELAQQEVDKALRRVEREISKAKVRAEKEARRAEERMRNAQERMRRAQERAARAARRAHRKVVYTNRGPFSIGVFHGVGSPPGREGSSQEARITEEEQLAVLRMVQEGKITVEEAEQLLKALDS